MMALPIMGQVAVEDMTASTPVVTSGLILAVGAGTSNCYHSIQSALDAASPGDTILVNPGVYAPFIINGKNDITVRGVNADAVFVDGGATSYAAKIQNAAGVHLENMTLRNTTNAIELDGAGANGYITPTLRTQVNSLLVYDFAMHAIYMDRSSNVALSQTTLVGGAGSLAHIEIYGPADPTFDYDWNTSSTDSRTAVHNGGGLRAAGEKVYVLPGDGSVNLYAYDPTANSWTATNALASVPGPLTSGSALADDGVGKLFALRAPSWDALGSGLAGTTGNQGARAMVADANGNLYVGGDFETAGGVVAGDVARWDGHNWSTLSSGIACSGKNAYISDMALDNAGQLYIVGQFSCVSGDIAVPYLAYYNGGGWLWAGPDPGMANGINTVAVDTNGNLYVGDCESSGPTLAKGVRSTEAPYFYSWTTLLSGPNCVNSLAADDQGNIYVGGSFTNAGGVSGASNIARYNGSSWSALGSGVSGAVADLDYDQGYVNVIGSGVPNYVTRWNVSAGVWQTPGALGVSSAPSNIVADGNDLFVSGLNGTNNYMAHWDGSSWSTLTNFTPNESVTALAIQNKMLYAGGRFTQVGVTTVNYITRWTRPLYQYGIAANNWSELTPFLNYNINQSATITGTALASDGANALYLLPGNSSAAFYRYDLNAGTWASQANLPANTGAGAALAFANSALYALRGGGTGNFYRYLPASNTWEARASMPYAASTGASLAWDGGNWLYALVGGKQFLKYNLLSDQWQVLGDGSSATPPGNDNLPIAATAGAGLVFAGNTLYAVPGGGDAHLWNYGSVAFYPQKLTLNQVAFVVDDAAASGMWLNFASPGNDFVYTGANNAWVGRSGTTWSPLISLGGGSAFTHAQAAFLDPARAIYRLTAGSAHTAGYHTYRADAVVAPSGAEFTSIQAALLSGANRVAIQPGVYPESFYLLNGVTVAGSGADLTIVESPASFAGTLVSIEGVSEASLSRLTINGNNLGVAGLKVEDGATVAFSRSIVRGVTTGITLSGADTHLELFNDTLVENANGLVVTSCTPLDIRNTVFAFNSDIGLRMDSGSCSPLRRHTYNLFWRNGADLSPSQPGPGELFLDPLFADRYSKNFQLGDNSPAIDSGNPSDPYPPGAGQRVDIGYLEYSRAAFYADDNYCETCANDGLTWQVDAFNVIQDALNAAGNYLTQFGTPATYLSVGVGPGVYHEQLRVPGYVHLFGSGADKTTVDGGGGSAVTFQGAVQSQVSGFTLTGAGGSAAAVNVSASSSAIVITRNLIRDNGFGVRFDGRSSGHVSFNTIVNSTQAGVVSGFTSTADAIGSWATVETNILSGNAVGLQTRYGGQLFNDYNLLFNATNDDDQAHTGLATGAHDLIGQDPKFANPAGADYHLMPGSPAVDTIYLGSETEPGGGNFADMGCFELLATPLSIFLGAEGPSTAIGSSGVSTVEFGVSFVADPSQPITATLPSLWTAATLESPHDTYSYWDASYTPAQDGLYRIYSRSRDDVGNQETDAADWYEGAFVADGTAPALDWNSTPLGLTLINAPAAPVNVTAPLELRSQVANYTPEQFSLGTVYFEVDGSRVNAAWATETWQTGQPRAFRAWVSLDNGLHLVRSFAVDSAGNVGQSALLELNVTGQVQADTTAPDLTIGAPAAGTWITDTVTITGTASDNIGGSGLASVEISPDGGFTWLAATVTGADWSLVWESPQGQAYTSIPIQVRATDRAGNSTLQEHPLTVDNVPPTEGGQITFSDAPGTHFDMPTSLVITVTVPEDGSGSASALFAVDQMTNTVPSAVMAGVTVTEALSLPGEWYVHIGATDAAGNQTTSHYGPWHVGTFADTPVACGRRQQTIIVDGYLDLANNEWRATELLDNDERPHIANNTAATSQLYASWDGNGFYLGWQGAWWALDGDLWAYLDTQGGGTTNGIETLAGPVILPFLTDLAVHITSRTEGSLWRYSGGQWTAISGLEFSQGDNGDTEVHIPWTLDSLTGLNFLAFAVSDNSPSASDSHVWSSFPTSNPLSGSPSGYYHWNNLCSVAVVNDAQPRAGSVLMTLTSSQVPGSLLGPNAGLTYVINLANQEARLVNGLQLELQATTGLTYLAADGATCADCAASDHWLLNIPPLDAAQSQVITITAMLASDLAGLSNVNTGVALKSAGVVFSQASLSHGVDGDAPSVSITALPGKVLPVGLFTVSGTADDGNGGGVAFVDVSSDGVTWVDATGMQNWSAEVNVPPLASSFTLWVRATDRFGLSATTSETFAIDPTAPTLTISLSHFLTGTAVILGGSAADKESLVTLAEVQIDGEDTPWLPALVYSPQDGQQSWLYTWATPSEDGILHTLRGRSTDAVGNISAPTTWLTTTVDNVAPQVMVSQPITAAQITDYLPGGAGGPVLSGTASDGSGMASMTVWVYDPASNVYQEPVPINQNSWLFTPHISQLLIGEYTLWVDGIDNAGNQRTEGPFHLFLGDEEIGGLQLVSSSPTSWGNATVFTATFQAGTHVGYAWNFGDGVQLGNNASAVISHTYTVPGTYTATVTASNTAGNVSESVVVQAIAADVSLSMQVSLSTAANGDVLTYTLTAFNNGPFAAHGVVVTDTLPPGVTLVAALPSQGSCDTRASQIVCTLGTLQNQGKASVLIVVQVARRFDMAIVNRADIGADERDHQPGNNAANISVNPSPITIIYLPLIFKQSGTR